MEAVITTIERKADQDIYKQHVATGPLSRIRAHQEDLFNRNEFMTVEWRRVEDGEDVSALTRMAV